MAISRKKLEGQYIAHVAREIARLVDEQYEGNQTKAAKALGMSQPHISNLINGTAGRGPGLAALILLRHVTNRSIDSLLGLPPLGGDELVERLRATIDTEVARIARSARLQQSTHITEKLAAAEQLREAREATAPPAPVTVRSEVKSKKRGSK